MQLSMLFLTLQPAKGAFVDRSIDQSIGTNKIMKIERGRIYFARYSRYSVRHRNSTRTSINNAIAPHLKLLW
jgi:hypothetical protein